MKIRAVIRARELLGLPPKMKLLDVCQYLLDGFDATYPVVRGDYHEWVKDQVFSHNKLVGATGWTRYCFGNPSKNKQDLNALVAHCPQSLNAMILNQAYVKVHREIALPNPKDFKLCAQIHDSILFQYRKGREDLAHQVKEAMNIPTLVRDIKGVSRLLVVPVDLKLNGRTWSECA
jgi:DNA polymerase I-like protein with 3'-5' exonuclease and polymerase domains